MILTVCKDSIVVVFVGNGTAVDSFRAAIAYIGCLVQTVAAFPDKVGACLVAGGTGRTLYPAKNNLVASIGLITTIPLLTEVLFVVKGAFVEPVIQAVRLDLLGDRGGILAKESGNILE